MRVLGYKNDEHSIQLKTRTGAPVAVPYSPSTERKRSCPNKVCMISKVDSFCIFKFRGPAIALETNIVSWRVFFSSGRRRPWKFEN
jgi:hypothetical protein